MNATILDNVFLINEMNFEENSKILFFLSNENRIFACIALGVRKITSKNSRNLFYGHNLSIEFFQARQEQKISKLKKVVCKDSINQDLCLSPNLLFLNSLFFKLKDSFDINLNTYDIYCQNLFVIRENFNDDYFIKNLILINSQHLFGINLTFNHCAECKTKNNIASLSIKKTGLLCFECKNNLNEYLFDKQTIYLFYYLCKKNYEEALKYKQGSIALYKYLKKLYEEIIGITIN